MRIYRIESGFQSGACNMALDEALLETVRQPEQSPVMIVRTYCWEVPTLSLGVHQAVKDIDFLMAFYGKNSDGSNKVRDVVRRPTGGRAILHGDDVSFSFTTNDPALLPQSLKASYVFLSRFVQQALGGLQLSVQASEQAGSRDYLRSPVCFETHTPSDLLAQSGDKLSGSAQLRRQGGILQHGAAFLQAYDISAPAFSAALFEAVARHYGQTAQDYPLADIETLRDRLEKAYLKESGEILASAPVTSGSHLLPASC